MMSEVEEGQVKEAVKAPEKSKAEIKMEETARQRDESLRRKQAAAQLADYKKRIREGNELKKLQVEELELNIRFYESKKQWMELAPKMEELEAREQAVHAEHRKKEKEAYEQMLKDREATDAKPKIITTGGGKPRKK